MLVCKHVSTKSLGLLLPLSKGVPSIRVLSSPQPTHRSLTVRRGVPELANPERLALDWCSFLHCRCYKMVSKNEVSGQGKSSAVVSTSVSSTHHVIVKRQTSKMRWQSVFANGCTRLSVCVFVCVCERERERDRQTDRQTDRQRQRQKQRERTHRSQLQIHFSPSFLWLSLILFCLWGCSSRQISSYFCSSVKNVDSTIAACRCISHGSTSWCECVAVSQAGRA